MGKQAKSRSNAVQAKAAAVGKSVTAKANNPFDKFSNARKKHDVLNRRVKGEDRNVGRARDKAIDERKKKLLTDYQSNKKSSVVIDKRFGENDPTMSLEEKMFLRLQKEKLSKVSRNMAQYNLDDDAEDNAVLTHKGQVLGESNLQDAVNSSDDEEDTGKLGKDVVNRLHFGGGLVAVPTHANTAIKGSGDKEEQNQSKKGRLEALQEIVMKSKLHKMQRKEMREEMDNERERLDAEFDSLLTGDLVDFDPNAGKRRRGRSGEEEGDHGDAYDQSLQAMMYETKRQPGERTKTAEELALETHKRMEEAEKQRKLRMRVVGEDAAKLSAGRGGRRGAGAGAGAALSAAEADEAFSSLYGKTQKKRVRNDDELDDFAAEVRDEGPVPGLEEEEDEDEEEEEEYGEDAFDEHSDMDEDEEGDDEEEEDEEGDDDDDDEEEEEEVGDEEEEEAEEDGDGEDEELDSDAPLGSEDEDEDEDEEQAQTARSRRRPRAATAAPGVDAESFEDMPHTLEVPESLQALHDLVARYCPGASWEEKTDAINELLKRVVEYNSMKLPGEAGAANRQAMIRFLPVLYKHFLRIGDLVADASTTDPALILRQVDRMGELVFSITADLPPARGSVITTKLLRELQLQLQKAMLRFAQGENASSFPGTGALLALALLGQVYSASDLKHDLLDPAKLLLSQMLAQCTVESPGDLCKGVMVCCTLLDYTKDSHKLLPEVLTFVAQALVAFGAQPTTHMFSSATLHPRLHALRQAAASAVGAATEARIQWKMCGAVEASGEVAACILGALLVLVDELVERYSALTAFPEASYSVFEALRCLCPHVQPALSQRLQQRTLASLERLTAAREQAVHARQPLLWRPVAKACVESKAPRYEVNYTFRKDQDTDKDRVKLKQLGRELKREKKAAMRELRRDAAFLDNERFQEKRREREEQRDERVKNFAWLEDQQATLNEQVRKGKGLMEMKGGGTGQLKLMKRKMKR